MDPIYKARFTPQILAEAAARYGANVEAFHELDGFESFIYEFRRDDKDCVLRVGHSNRRPESMVKGEAEWLHYLRQTGCDRVARPVESNNGNLVEAFADGKGEQFIATAFDKAPGRHMGQADATPSLYEEWGALLGRIHALSVNFRPRWPRPHWDDPIIIDTDNILRQLSETGVHQRFSDLRNHLNSLPSTDTAAYGMIHQDAHPGNFFIDPQPDGLWRITLFDFDDCCFSWYANDIAIVLFYAVMGQPDTAAFTRSFLTHFLRGYRLEKEISTAWLAEIPAFLKLREIDLYAVILRDFDVENTTNGWVKRYMDGRKERIEAGVPYIDFDFTSLEEKA